MTSDLDLLRQFARENSQDAFTALVNRHVNLVYSAALRQVRSPQLAEEVAQSVFADLARDAGRLKPDTILTAWLYQVTRRTAIDVVRKESRRQLREQIAVEMNNMNPDASSRRSETKADDWAHVEPFLDEAMHTLDDTDRAAVLLRYFENKSFHDVGQSLGTSDDAAQKRVSRAVERLREFFAKRGVTVGASGLVVVIAANAVQAAPIGLAVTISTAAVAGIITTTTVATHVTMNWINIKSIAAIVTAAFVAGTTVYVVQQSETHRLQNENRNLAAQVKITTSERDTAIATAAQVSDEIEQLRKDKTELLRLRGEVGRLRSQISEFPKLQAGNRALGGRASTASDPTSAQGQVLLSPEAGINGCLNNLRRIDAAMQECALEHNLTAANVITAEQILPYLIEHKLPQCPSGGTYTFGSLTNAPTCSIPGHALPSEAPAVELQLGVVMQAIIQDHNGQLPADDLAEAREAYKQDHNGQAPRGIGDFVTYLKQPGPRLRAALDAYKRDHTGQAATNALELVPYLRSVSDDGP